MARLTLVHSADKTQPTATPAPVVSEETVRLLEARVEEAKQGKLIGVAITCMYRDWQTNGYVTGTVKRHPTFALGMLGRLWAKLERSTDDSA